MSGSSSQVPEVTAFSFWSRQVERLGDQNPLEVMTDTPRKINEFVAQQAADDLQRRPAQDKWSPVEIIGHLIDTEWVFGFRARTTFADEPGSYGGIDQDRWVAAQNWQGELPQLLAGVFSAVRAANLVFWQRLTEDDLARTGRHEEAGVDLSLGQLRAIQAGHDLVHLDLPVGAR